MPGQRRGRLISVNMRRCLGLLIPGIFFHPSSTPPPNKPPVHLTATAAAADIEVATTVVGSDSTLDIQGASGGDDAAAAAAAAAAVRSSSPLCRPESTVEQRNAYLREMGIERMKQVRGARGVRVVCMPE